MSGLAARPSRRNDAPRPPRAGRMGATDGPAEFKPVLTISRATHGIPAASRAVADQGAAGLRRPLSIGPAWHVWQSNDTRREPALRLWRPRPDAAIVCAGETDGMAMAAKSPAEFEHAIGQRIGRGDLAGAGRTAMACRQVWPDAAAGWLLGSMAALLADEKESALALAELWLARHPADVRCLLQRAECLFALNRRADALSAAQAAAEAAGRAPVQPAALDGVGYFLVHAGEHAAALQAYDRAILAAPDDPDLLSKRAVVHRYLGNFAAAAADHEAVLALLPGDPDALKGLADLNRQTEDRNRLETMQQTLSRLPADSREASTLHFALAKSFDDLQRYAESWSHLAAGNRIERGLFEYEASTDRAALERIAAAFPDIESVRPDTSGERPIFIVGLPRTGTTLVERIIGNHSAVHSAGELSALSEAIGAAVDRCEGPKPRDWLDYGTCLGRVDAAYVARRYLDLAQTRRGDRPYFSDKQPTNFVYCPLILRAFPNARIVHLTRHPLAAGYAIFKTRFVGTYPFAYDLREIGEFYVGYRRLMRHWHAILPGRILDLAYEDVVQAIEPATRRLLDYLGLPFEPACLEFHLNPRSTSTASAVQVRQPLYDSSLHQWRHYAAQLTTLRDQLAAAGIAVD